MRAQTGNIIFDILKYIDKRGRYHCAHRQADIMENDEKPGNKKLKQEILKSIIRIPHKSDNEIACDLGTYREKVWRLRKKLEGDRTIWGYSVIIDDKKEGRGVYLVLLKSKPLTAELIDDLFHCVADCTGEFGVHLKSVCYFNSDYDFIIYFSSPDHPSASRFYEFLKKRLGRHLAEKPLMVDVAFTIAEGGVLNPEKDKMYVFVPD